MKKQLKRILSACLVVCAAYMLTAAGVQGGLFSQKQEPLMTVFSKTDLPGSIVTFSSSDFTSRTQNGALSGVIISELPENGELRLAGSPVSKGKTVTVDELASLSFVPNVEESVHTSFSFIPVFRDTGAALEPITVSINLTERDNSAPVAKDISCETYQDVAVVVKLSAFDAEEDPCTYKLSLAPKKGAASIEGNTLTYTPSGSKTGSDQMTFIAVDSFGSPSEEATVSVEIRKRPSASDVFYTDMAKSTAHYAAIKLSEAGVLRGETIGASTFLYPEKAVTRAEFTALATAAFEIPALTTASGTGMGDNDDIPTWVKPYVASAVSTGVISGSLVDGNRVFRANDTITRAEAAAVINRALELRDETRALDVADLEAIPSWAESAIKNTTVNGILSLFDDGSVRANGEVSREDAVSMVYEAMQYQQEKTSSGGLFGLFK